VEEVGDTNVIRNMNPNSRARGGALSRRTRGVSGVQRGSRTPRVGRAVAVGAAARGEVTPGRVAPGQATAIEGEPVLVRAVAVNDRGRLRERFRAETREAILSAAEVALAEHGARGAKMEVIASAAGIAVGTLYNYFDDRQELIEALLELRRGELLARLDAALESSAGLPFEQKLEAFLGAALGHFQAHRAFIALLMHDELTSERSTRWSTLLALRARAERLIVGGVDSGVLRAEDRATYPYVLVGLIKGLLEPVLETEGLEVTTQLLAPAVRCFLWGARS
jgi:AcrR family transcriptional regulator